jgi:hypothetical protein
MTLPFTGEVVDFRPFLVKEEKLLVMAKDSGDRQMIIRTVGDIVRDCTDGKVDANIHPMFHVEYAFLEIRGKSVGEEIEYFLVCGKCGHKTTTFTKVEEFKLLKHEGHTNNVVVNEEIRLTMKYPTFEDFVLLFGDTEEDSPHVDAVVARCVDTMITKDEVIKITRDNRGEIQEFIDNMLPEQYSRIEQFFATMPVLQCEKEFTCEKCGTDNEVNIGGISNFFV